MAQTSPAEAAIVPVTPRPAASLLVVRQAGAAPRVLMGLRGAGHRFMPNKLVFPGGAVDPADYLATTGASPAPHVRRLLDDMVGCKLAAALPLAAARELQEESGLSLGSPPDLARLDYLCRAITPAASPIRFDAHFFVVAAEDVTGEPGGSGELEDLRFYALPKALALDLAAVTRSVIRQLMAWLSMTPAQRAERTTVPVMRERVWQPA